MVLSLPILFESDANIQADLLGIKTSLLNDETKEVTFYTIDAITPYSEDGVEYCEIYSGGGRFLCTLTYGEVKHLLK